MYDAKLKKDIYNKTKKLGAEIVRSCSVDSWEQEAIQGSFCTVGEDMEKHLPAMQEENRQRHKATAEARGEVWLSPDELAEQERSAMV